MTGVPIVTADQRRDLRQLAGATAFALWLTLYVDANTSEAEELAGLLRRNGGDVRLAAADLLYGLVDGEETIKRLKLEGELEVEFTPATYASKAGALLAEVQRAGGGSRVLKSPLAGIITGRSDAPQAFKLGPDLWRSGEREGP